MIEMAEDGCKLSKEEYLIEVERLRPALLELQQKLRKRGDISVVILLSGAEGAGKGETVQMLTSWLDPRGVDVNAFGPDDDHHGRPPFWRYWMHLPPKGKIGIFFSSWYAEPALGKALKKMKKSRFLLDLQQIKTFERHLAAENVLLVKCWLHLSKKAMTEREKSIKKDPAKAWMLTRGAIKTLKSYNRYYKTAEQLLSATSIAEAPWTVINASDKPSCEIAVVKTIMESVSKRLAQPAEANPVPMTVPKIVPKGVLDHLNMDKRIERKEYEEKLALLQAEISRLSWEAFALGITTVVLFEGWDAAGKGGSIRRLTGVLDARNYHVIPIAAPTDEEKAHPYLWRFWRQLPTSGKVAIFDRSWYGRVLVERVEGFCHPEDWQRAYVEINDFEAQMAGTGIVVIKYWLHLSPEEQLRRFNEREKTAFKQYKLTDEDWRNRKKWNAYLVAANEMFSRTSTTEAPWNLIAADDKRSGRLQVLSIFRDRLKEAVRQSRKRKIFTVRDR